MKILKINKKNKKGFTLVEILLVVGFIALAGIGIYTVYTKVQMSNAALTEAKNLDTMRAGIKNLFGGNQNYNGLSNLVINQARITPDSMRAIPYSATDANITNSFGGTVTVTPVTLGSGSANNGFRIQYDKVPGAVCAKLVGGAGASWDAIGVGAVNNVKVFGTGQINIATLTAQCATDTGNGISLYFDSL
jgi:type II secretory pathway pseudopilin PulG